MKTQEIVWMLRDLKPITQRLFADDTDHDLRETVAIFESSRLELIKVLLETQYNALTKSGLMPNVEH